MDLQGQAKANDIKQSLDMKKKLNVTYSLEVTGLELSVLSYVVLDKLHGLEDNTDANIKENLLVLNKMLLERQSKELSCSKDLIDESNDIARKINEESANKD